MNGFLPPVVFQIQANATQAIASFRKVNAELSVMEAKALKAGKALTGMQKAAIAGTKALKILGLAAVAFAVIGVREAEKTQKEFIKLGRALANAGLSTEQTRKQTAELVESYEDLGFGSDEAAKAMGILVTATGDVTKSQKYLAIAADVARYKGMDLAVAAKQIARAGSGAGRIFKEFGITLDKNLPKTEASAKAIEELARKTGGNALDYTKTLSGQLAILNETLGDLFEWIGFKIIPVLNKFIEKINGTGKFIKDHTDIVIALAAAITILLIPAIVNLTKKLYLLTLTILKSPLFRIAAAVFAVALSFVKAWNASEQFRRAIIETIKTFINGFKIALELVYTLYNGVLLLQRGFANLGIWMAKISGDKKSEENWRKTLESIDKTNAGFKKTLDTIDEYKKELDGLNKPINLNLKLGIPKIPKFGNYTGDTSSAGTAGVINDALVKAAQRITDFSVAIKKAMSELNALYKTIVKKDYKKAIEDGLLNPTEQLVMKTQSAVNGYQKASNQYQTALVQLAKAESAYISAVKNGNAIAIAATESNLKRAEDAVNALQDSMKKNLENVAQYQDEMINEIVESYKQIKELQSDRAKTMSDYYAEALSLQEDYNDQVKTLNEEYNKSVTEAQKEAAKRTAEIYKQSMDSLRNVFKNATYKSIGDIYDALTYQGKYLKGGSTQKILDALLGQTKKAETLAGDAAKLSSLGFTQSFIEEVVSQGPEVGHSLAQTIINSTPESIAKMKEYWGKLKSTSTNGVDAVAAELTAKFGVATDEMKAELASVAVELQDQLKGYYTALQTGLTDAWDTYSKALDKLRRKNKENTDEIDKQIRDLQMKIAQLETALANLPKLGAPGTIQTPTSVTAPVIQQPTYNAPVRAGQGLPPVAGVAQTVGGNAAGATRQIVVGGNNITVSAQTNASPQQIAQDVGWAIRTSADVQYYMVGGTKVTVPAGKGFF